MEKSIGAYEARRKFGQLIEEAFYRHDHFVIERAGRAMAVIVPVDEYLRWKRLAKEGLLGMIEGVWEHNKEVPSDELEKDVEDDPSDNKILACALEGQVEHIVASDQHLTSLDSFSGIPIVPPRRFPRVLDRKGQRRNDLKVGDSGS